MMQLYKLHGGMEQQAMHKPNVSHNWFPMDTEKLFLKNKQQNPRNISLNYYIENPIKYELNNFGFRTPDDFNSKDEGNVFLGCSHTFGIGLHLENTWSYLLNQKIGGKFWNLSIPGTGIPTHFRMLLGYYKELNIKNIFHFAPKYNRFEFFVNASPTPYQVTNMDTWKSDFGKIYQESLTTQEQMHFTYDTHYRAIKSIADELKIGYYIICDSMYDNMNRKKSLLGSNVLEARDLMHFNVDVHQQICDRFYKFYNGGMKILNDGI
jgi:hypothetical protein